MINRLVDLETGRGKTIIAAFALLKLGLRFGVIVLPKYIDKWIGDITKLTDITEEEIFVVQGGSSIDELVRMVDEVGIKKLKYRAFIFSNKTLQLYIKDYMSVDDLDEFNYDINPMDLMSHIGISTLLNDETHQEFHSIFIMLCFFNISHFVGLSATLDTHDSKLRQMYDLLFPGNGRISNIAEFNQYINVIAVQYYVDNPKRLKHRTNKGYSNILFEQSIMKNNIALRGYIEMIIYGINNYYLDRAEEGDKCLIFCTTIDLCNIVKNYIEKQYPNKDIRTYTADDPYENILEADITVSTFQSSGPLLATIDSYLGVPASRSKPLATGA